MRARIQHLSQRRRRDDSQAKAHLYQRQVQEEDNEQGGSGIGGPTERAAPSRRGFYVVDVRALRGAAVPPLARPHPPAPVQRGGVAELRPLAPARVDVEHTPPPDEHL